MVKRAALTGVALFICVSVAIPGAIKTGSSSASSNGTNVTVRWLSDNESAVTHYQLSRRAGTSGDFIPLANLPCQGNSRWYEFVDNTAFRTTEASIYQYLITPVYLDGPHTAEANEVTVSVSVSSVRRTWGSIKAMFR
jgi:hypothetical protein